MIESSEFTSTLAAATAPNFTVDPLENPVPSMVTWVPPPVGPLAGLDRVRTPVTVGVVTKLKRLLGVAGDVVPRL